MKLNCFADCHSHTNFSFDAKHSVDAMCASAVERGLSALAITDHCDYDNVIEGLYTPYDAENIYKAISVSKEKYDGKLTLIYGIELGEGHLYSDQARGLIEKYGFDFVLGSLHNLKKSPDFSFMDFSVIDTDICMKFFARSLDEIYDMLDFEYISSLAHINYPMRYIRRGGHDFSYESFLPKIEKIFRRIIERDIALEVNTSGWHKAPISPDPDKRTMPDRCLVEFYYNLGGRLITVGSDAHAVSQVGVGIKETLSMLQEIGFKEITIYIGGRPVMVPLLV
ncbi:MAG: histidinol-phosphatase HisJ family protein [Clostridiales bacterium]|nr:histidinol-phosphatase HisJ family protein [Clostridiales bacterium]